MKTVTDGSSFTTILSFADSFGNFIEAVSATYSLKNGSGVELESGPVTVLPTDTEATVTILPTNNALPIPISGFKIAESRLLELRLTDASGVVHLIKEIYGVMPSEEIGFMNDSYQSLQDAELLALKTPDIDSWHNATEQEKTNALRYAFMKMGRHSYVASLFTKDLLEYATEFNTQTSNTAGVFFLNNRQVIVRFINELSVSVADNLPQTFWLKIKLAQLLEATSILDGSEAAQVDQNGSLISETVGESTKVWNKSQPIKLLLSKRAMNVLTGLIHYDVRISR